MCGGGCWDGGTEAGGDLGSPDHNTLAVPDSRTVQELGAQNKILFRP